MTADVDVCAVGDVPKGDVEEKGSYQDLRRENNGVVIISGSNADKEDVDRSYVFVGGSDSVSNDHVEPTDLNGVAEVVVVENGECYENNGGGGGLEGSECEVKVGQVRGSNGAEEEYGPEAVGEFEPQAHPQPQRLEVEEQIKVEESSEDARQIKRSPPVVPDAAESDLCKSSMQVHEGGAQDSNLGSTAESELLEIAGEEEDTKPDLSTEGKENHKSRDIISMDVQNDFVREKEATELETNEAPLEDAAQENLAVDMAHSSPSPVAGRELETEVSNTGPVAVENGDGSPINLTEDNSLKSLGANQITAEQNGSSENAESLSSTPFGCGNAVANEITVELDSEEHELDLEQNSNTEVVSNENGDCLPTDPDQNIILENSANNESAGAIQSTAEQNGSSQDAESLPSPPFVCANEVSVEADSVKHEAGLEQSSKTRVIPNQNGNCLPTNHDQAIISEISVHNDLVGTIRSTPEQNGSFRNVDRLHSPVLCGSVPESGESFPTSSNNDTAAKENIENGPAANEIPVEADSGELEVDVQQSSNMEVVSIENGVCIPADDQNGISEISVNNDSVGVIQNTPEQNGSSQDVDCLLSPSMFGNKLLESFPTAPNNDTVVKEDTNNGAENRPDYNISGCHAADDAKLETETGSVAIDSEEKVTDLAADAPKKGPEVSNLAVDCADGQPHPVAATGVQCHVNGFVENDLSVKSETEVESTLTLSSRDMPCDDDDDDIKSESKVGVGSANLIESALNCDLDVDGGDQFTGTDSGSKPSYQGAEVVSGINCDETSTPSPEGSTDAFEGQNAEVVKRPFYYLIRLPRYDDENLREQTTHAQLQVDEKTRNRDAIQAEIRMKRVTLKGYGDNLEATLLEEEAARHLLKSKRREMDSAQSVINRLKNVIAVKDIDGRIHNMEHAMQHETLPMTEEKQFIREIKQLKQHRAQLSSNSQQDDVQEALDQKEKTEALLKLLRKELDILRDNVLKAEAVTKTAKKKYNGESEKLKELHAQFTAADAIRQEAYAHLQSLKKQFHEKNKHFWKYRDDINAAADLASKVKREELQRFCVNQVEKVMELWNKNDEFRKEYIRCNTRSTLRRLRTLDGRSLGPDEEPPLIPNVVYERMHKALPPQSAAEQGKQIVQLETEKVKEKPLTVVVEQKKQTTKSKIPVKPLGNGLATVSGREEIEEAREEEPKQTKEEEELARKMEQLRREEEEAKLREQHLLEEKAKAKEALERKKRKAEKAQTKAMLRVQREAEEKEKEREKRARKKERKKAAAAAVEATDGDNKKEASPGSETPTESLKESETREKPITKTKRSKKPSQFSKQSKGKSIPPPLRNRNKRRMQPWMWVLLTALIVFALILVGNSSFSFDFGRQRFGF
ncbi:calponin homology domain-containing protein DDB_G0272472-like isoform X2 [Juglans microcarpa x Juglans regia]|uniref:calponin homology domain-containing protein DDB_G0272472-like isoform X2 n=1 Tax=Juglans microcarpa x Juglans regia TaxID=2249226 RepID=UPI001B7F6557|nr:calponin homology domain-containing protein DDB_G0272472-like isoform X2 [Juglans microcarpa x Juglans regia]